MANKGKWQQCKRRKKDEVAEMAEMQEKEKWLVCKTCGCFKLFEGITDMCCRANGKECGPWEPSRQEVGKEGLSIELAFPYADCKEQKADQAPQGASSAADASAKKTGAPPSDATK